MSFVDHYVDAAVAVDDFVPASLNDWNDDVKCDEPVAVAQSSCLGVSLAVGSSGLWGLRWIVTPCQHWTIVC